MRRVAAPGSKKKLEENREQAFGSAADDIYITFVEKQAW